MKGLIFKHAVLLELPAEEVKISPRVFRCQVSLGRKALNALGMLRLQARHLKRTHFPLKSLSASLSTSQLLDLQEPQHPMPSKGNGGLHAARGTW